MTGRTAGRSVSASLALPFAALLLLWAFTGTATSQEQRDCSDFATQEEAQQFYDDHKDDDPDDPDPFELDTDGDGQACEGLPTSAAAASPTPAATAEGNSLPQNGVETGVIAMSGLSLLEAGYGLTLASKRLGIRRRSIPLYLMRRMVTAAERGGDRIEVAEDVYLVHRSALESPLAAERFDDGTDDADFDLEADGFVEVDDAEIAQPILPSAGDERPAGPSVYAALARPHVLPKHDA